MSTVATGTSDFDAVLSPFVEFWKDYTKRADDMTRELFSGFDDGSEIKSWQRKWMDSVSRSMDAYMRTPAFLEAIKQHTEAVVTAKQRSDDLCAEFARNANIPTTNDISGLFERLKSFEGTIVSQLTRVEKRLDAIETRMNENRAPV
jgi:hypothetical protein